MTNLTKQKIVSKLKYYFPVLFLVMPFLAYAQSTVSNGLQTSGLQSIFGTGGLNSSQSLSDLIANVIRVLLIFAGVIAIVFVIIGGYQYIVSGGNEETAEKGKKTLINAIIGIVVIVLAYAIINVIVNLVGSSSGYGF
jgi:FMN-dependent NADH-azoreductase